MATSGLAMRIPVPGHGEVSARLHAPRPFRPGITARLVLAHGAGNDMHLPLLVAVGRALADAGRLVLRLNFPYKERGNRAPDRAPVLMATLRAAVARLEGHARWRGGPLFLGGKSMGGRMASMIAAEGTPSDGLVFLGYPLHPAGRREETRDAHFTRIRVPSLFIQGTRDPLCDLALLRPRLDKLGGPARLHVIDGGDHSFNLPKRLGRGPGEVHAEIAGVIDAFMNDFAPKRKNKR